jgi:hypothetical protein
MLNGLYTTKNNHPSDFEVTINSMDSPTCSTDYSLNAPKHMIRTKNDEIEALRNLVAKQQNQISDLMECNEESVMGYRAERDHVERLTYFLEKSNERIYDLTQILKDKERENFELRKLVQELGNSVASLPSSDHFSVRPSADPPSSCNTFLPPPARAPAPAPASAALARVPAPSEDEEILEGLLKQSDELVGLIESQECEIEDLRGEVQDNKNKLSEVHQEIVELTTK